MLVPKNILLLRKHICACWWYQKVSSPLSKSGDISLNSDLRVAGLFDNLRQKWNNWYFTEIILLGLSLTHFVLRTMIPEQCTILQICVTLISSSAKSTENNAWHSTNVYVRLKPFTYSTTDWLLLLSQLHLISSVLNSIHTLLYLSVLSLSLGSWWSIDFRAAHNWCTVLHTFRALYCSPPSPGSTSLHRKEDDPGVEIVVGRGWQNTVTLGGLI